MKNILLGTLLVLSSIAFFAGEGPHQKAASLPTVEVGLMSSALAQDAAAPAASPVVSTQAQPAVAAPVVAPPPSLVDPKNPDKPIEDSAFLKYLLDSVGGIKGLGAMGLAAFLAQLLAAFMMTPMFAKLVGLKKPIEEWMGKWKMALVCGLVLLSGVCMLIATGLDWKAALVHSSTLAMANVFVHQVWKQATEKKDSIPA